MCNDGWMKGREIAVVKMAVTIKVANSGG
jgi:hypothetical protein